MTLDAAAHLYPKDLVMSRSIPLERAFVLLDLVASANRNMTLVEIVQSSGLPQSSVFRLASKLVESGMLAFDPRGKTYRVGSRALRLSFLLTGRRTLEDMSEPPLETLAQQVEETAFFVLSTPEGNRLLRYVVPELGARAFIHPGSSFPAHATAAGKVIAAFSSGAKRFGVDTCELEKFQSSTITDPKELPDVYEQVRELGYATNDSELDINVYSACAPIFFTEEVVGALGFVGPRERVLEGGAGGVAEHIGLLCQEATGLSRLLAST